VKKHNTAKTTARRAQLARVRKLTRKLATSQLLSPERQQLSHLHEHRVGGSAREIAVRFGLSRSFVANILKELCHKGFVSSHRGVNGGYVIDPGASAVSLADFIAAGGGISYLILQSDDLAADVAPHPRPIGRKGGAEPFPGSGGHRGPMGRCVHGSVDAGAGRILCSPRAGPAGADGVSRARPYPASAARAGNRPHRVRRTARAAPVLPG